MKLTELLKQITPLPWAVTQPVSTDGLDAAKAEVNNARIDVWRFGSEPETYQHLVQADAAYLVHAANQLPQLINTLHALRAVRDGEWDHPSLKDFTPHPSEEINMRRLIDAALAAAETVA